MDNVSRTRKPGKRVRGYRITGLTKDLKPFNTGLLWLPSAPMTLWANVKDDPNTYSARLIRSGRIWLKHDPWSQKAMEAPLNRQAGFSLMR